VRGSAYKVRINDTNIKCTKVDMESGIQIPPTISLHAAANDEITSDNVLHQKSVPAAKR